MDKAIHDVRVIRFGTFEVDLLSGELRKAGAKLKLTGQPFQVLAILLELKKDPAKAGLFTSWRARDF
jgi:DNA-binding response OmpR family regulator